MLILIVIESLLVIYIQYGEDLSVQFVINLFIPIELFVLQCSKIATYIFVTHVDVDLVRVERNHMD